MKTILTERDITRIVKRVLKESGEKTYRVECEGCRLPTELEILANNKKITGTFEINSDTRTISYRSDNVWLTNIGYDAANNYSIVMGQRLEEKCQPLLQKHYEYMIKRIPTGQRKSDFFETDEWKRLGPICYDYERILSIIEDKENPLGLSEFKILTYRPPSNGGVFYFPKYLYIK